METLENQDDFKWFGEGFDGFPKRLPEDTVEYAIYIVESSLSQQKIASQLRQVLQRVKSFVKDLTVDYIWQRDPFNIELILTEGIWCDFDIIETNVHRSMVVAWPDKLRRFSCR
jgi:hypothetical protein